MEFQHVNIKLCVKNAEGIDLEALIPVFHRWIQSQSRGELLLDVADYRHVRSGPGVILIGHQGNYSLDNTGDRLGVRYNRKAVLEGTNQDRLVQATQAALAACRRLETEASLDGMIQFNGREIEVFINDRLLAPNMPDTRTTTDSEFRTFFATLFGDIEYAVSYPQDPRSLFSLHVKTSQAFDTTELLNNLNSMAPASHQS
jgi:hypothetical protein